MEKFIVSVFHQSLHGGATWTVETCPDAASQETFETPAVVGGGEAPPGTGSVGQPGDDDGPVCCLRQGPSAADGRMYHAYACVAAVQRDTWLFDCSAMNAVIQLNITRHKFVLTNCASILYSITATTRSSTESTKLTIRGFTRLLTALYTVVHSKRTVAVPLCH